MTEIVFQGLWTILRRFINSSAYKPHTK